MNDIIRDDKFLLQSMSVAIGVLSSQSHSEDSKDLFP